MIHAVHCEFVLFEPSSLKEKRSIVNSAKTRLKQKYNVAVAETDHFDLWQRTALSVVTVATDQQQAEKELSRALAFLDSYVAMERTTTTYERL
ncbi:hypothetical protein B0H94_101142 [Salsuginibacillus halophilus]|uniref:YlxP-like protein n=1 Tax=Salsuginibacillus halophilus TaxID=517424 RepID=A0A2P8HYA8_9BACI|nr:DUF503 family protein [Salsuginibacillus halophilus]PSL51232.1 hypothetical protein B0H94_101142 [Salsuginibacillus halophilus]